MAQLMMTAVGEDKPGLVGQLTGHLHAGGANIVESRMVNLRGRFAVMMLVEGTDEALGALRASLPGEGERLGLRVSVEAAESRATVQGVPYRLKTYSMDQPGLVYRITEVLRGQGVNIEELEARQESAAFAGTTLFTMELRLTVPGSVSVRKLKTELEAVCEQLNCDMDLEPAS